MKFLAAAGAFLAATASACMVDGDYSCHCLPDEFYAKQREAYMMYYSLMRSHGYDINAGISDRRPKQVSKYAYAEYIPGENPYYGRWKDTDTETAWITPKDAYRLNKHAVKTAEEYVHKVEDELHVTVQVVGNEELAPQEVLGKESFADQLLRLRGGDAGMYDKTRQWMTGEYSVNGYAPAAEVAEAEYTDLSDLFAEEPVDETYVAPCEEDEYTRGATCSACTLSLDDEEDEGEAEYTGDAFGVTQEVALPAWMTRKEKALERVKAKKAAEKELMEQMGAYGLGHGHGHGHGPHAAHPPHGPPHTGPHVAPPAYGYGAPPQIGFGPPAYGAPAYGAPAYGPPAYGAPY